MLILYLDKTKGLNNYCPKGNQLAKLNSVFELHNL
jgi:hypothetical protein